MSNTVVLVGALDTKGQEYAFVRDLVAGEGLETLVVDFGVMGKPAFTPDISREEVAAAAGADLGYLSSGEHKDEAMEAMAAGLAVVVRRLYDEGRLQGILGMGGSGGTSIATRAMRELPVGVPKIMVSTVGGGDVSAYAGSTDITFMPSIVDVAGINSISRRIYANAAGAIAGAVKVETPPAAEEKPLIAASMFGNTTEAVDNARRIMEDRGYEVLVFHATGSGGRTMESLIRDGFIAAALDITTTELADTVRGRLRRRPERYRPPRPRAFHRHRAGWDMANFWGIDSVPERYRQRNLYRWNPNVTLLRTNVEENRRIGEMIAAAANLATGPVAILLPLRGVSMLDSEGQPFWDPEADHACFEAIRSHTGGHVDIIEVDANVNDPAFSSVVAQTLLEMLDDQAQVGS